MKVLETRKSPEGYIHRTRLDGGAKIKTIEVPLDTWYSVYPKVLPHRKQMALQMLRENTKPAAVARETGYSITQIRRLMKDLNK